MEATNLIDVCRLPIGDLKSEYVNRKSEIHSQRSDKAPNAY